MFPTIKLIKTYSYEDRKIVYTPSPKSHYNYHFHKNNNNDQLLLDKDSFKKTTSFKDPYAYPN